jgi:hypothetical protein
MKNFGLLKSKIESKLVESYTNETFKEELKVFKKLVIENKNISKIFYLYDELTSPKSLSEDYCRQYINESITMYENTVNKIKQSDIKKINEWVSNVKTNNKYETIDDLFSTDVLTIETKIKSRNIISENLRKLPKIDIESPNIPLSSMVSIANKTIKNYVDGLDESDKKELMDLLSEDDTTLNEKYNTLKEGVIEKLTEMKNTNNDSTIQTRIEETLSKVISEKYDKLTYFKLKNLKENL